MTQEEKSILLTDLCARLRYKPKVKVLSFWNEDKEIEEDIVDSVYCVMPDGYINTETIDSDISLDNIVLYLRPMSSMTEEDIEDFSKHAVELELKSLESEANGPSVISLASSAYQIDWLNAHHFDYRGLIPMGLALEALENMYK